MNINMQRWPEHALGGYHHAFHQHTSPWPYPHTQHYHHTASHQQHYQPPSSNRHMRNMAEKMRRDKLNFYINQLSTLVPIISFSPKKLDKTSVLRLAATYIRLHKVIFGPVRQDRRSTTTSAAVHGQMMEYLPQYLASFNWSENVLEEMDGMLLIVNGAGRIIFISHTVEKLLGHTQIELMGQLLYNLTCLEDYDELKRNLAPDEDQMSSANSEGGADESSSDSCSSPSPRMPPLPLSPAPDTDKKLRRSFYIRLRQRAQSRSDQPQYELVHVMGHLRVPQRSQTSRRSEGPLNHNEIILVAVVKPFREKRITTLSLMEACREEFITRHTLDGRIIYTDHRISIVAGYLAEEVCGVPGFQYMHKEDMRWTMVGLRQMFFRGSSYGQSCYRLKTKNGTFIYLKTCGYLELSENNDSFQSLICINSLVSAVEGETLIRQMKDQYSPVIKNKNDRNMEILSSNIQVTHGRSETTGETEDPQVMEAAINQMISNVPSPAPFIHSPAASNIDPSEPQFAKATLAAKAMPPLSIHIKKIGIVPPIIRTPAAVAASLSPPSSHHSPPLPTTSSPPTTPVPPPTHTPTTPTLQNRPSVLRVAHRQGDQVSVMKVKRLRTEEGSQEVVTQSILEPVDQQPRSVLVSPGKRKSEEEWPVLTAAPALAPAPTPAVAPAPLQPSPHPLSPHFPLDPVELLTDTDFPDFNDGSPPSLSGNLGNLEDMDIYGMALSWAQPEVLESSHQSLDSRIQLQGDQIHEIQQDLTLVSPDHSDSTLYNSKLSQLQMEKVAKFLQHVYHKMDTFQRKLDEPI